MPTNNCDYIAIDTSSVEGEKLWRWLCAAVRLQDGTKTLARNYRNKLAEEGLTEFEKQKALEMFNNWGNSGNSLVVPTKL
jgi:hypothetical protein